MRLSFNTVGNPARGRWIFLLGISALLHWLALEWISGTSWDAGIPTDPAVPIVAGLYRAPAEPAPAASTPRPIKPRPRRPAAIPPPAPAAVTPALPSDETIATQAAPAEPEQSVPAAKAVLPPANPDRALLKADPPPSARLSYAVTGQSKGFPYHGSGMIDWQAASDRYTITGKASALFFTLLEFKSEGLIDESGVAPVIYEERSRNKAQTNTHFHRERNTISFSASTLSYPRAGGEQDRASVIWQLAALGRGSGESFKQDAEVALFVAGTRNAETWRIRILGEEDLELDGASTKAWHLRWTPRKGSYEKTIDIWLAPNRYWYPVKLRQTEVSGDYFELSLSSLELTGP